MYVDINAARTSDVRKLQSDRDDLREIILVHPVHAKEKCIIKLFVCGPCIFTRRRTEYNTTTKLSEPSGDHTFTEWFNRMLFNILK